MKMERRKKKKKEKKILDGLVHTARMCGKSESRNWTPNDTNGKECNCKLQAT
jgi:hypothetical protein